MTLVGSARVAYLLLPADPDQRRDRAVAVSAQDAATPPRATYSNSAVGQLLLSGATSHRRARRNTGCVRPTPQHNVVDRASGTAVLTRQASTRHPRGVQPADRVRLLIRQGPCTTGVNAPLLGQLDALSLPFADQLTLQFGDRTQHVQLEPGKRIFGGRAVKDQPLLDELNPHPTTYKLIDQIRQIDQ